MALTRREIDILRGIANGEKSYTIARNLNISEQTVKNQICTLMGKFGVHGRAELMFAILNEYRKGKPCIYKDITCQEGWCSECMIPLGEGGDDKAHIKSIISMLEVSLNRSMKVIDTLKASIV